MVHTLDRLGRTVRDTLNLIHELAERGVGVRNLAGPIRVDSSNPADPLAQLAVVLLALFGQMERTYTLERAAHARAVATAKGPPGSAARHRRPGPAGLRRSSANRRARHRRDSRQDRRSPDQPVPAPAAPAPRAGHRQRAGPRRQRVRASSWRVTSPGRRRHPKKDVELLCATPRPQTGG